MTTSATPGNLLGATNGPAANRATNRPAGKPTTNEPTTNHATNEPAGKPTTNEPTTNHATNEPAGKPTTNEPAANRAANGPAGRRARYAGAANAGRPGPRFWLAVLVTLAGLAATLTGQLGPNRDRIENDLTHRSVQALAAAGQGTAEVSVAGRDALVTAGSPVEAERARQVVAAVTGVRAVRTRVREGAGPVRVPPAVLVAVTSGRAVLTGTVPDAGTRASIRDAAAAAFGAGAVEDRITVAGTVAADPGLVALPAMLRSLPAGAAEVSVRLEAGTLKLAGTTSAETVRTALATAARQTGVPVEDRLTVAELQPQLAAVPSLEFRTGSAELTAASRRSLRRIAELLEANPSADVRIDGHTDSRGSRAANLAVSHARADAVRSALMDLGVAADRLTTAGYGESRPKAPNDSPEHRAGNRRVEMTVLPS